MSDFLSETPPLDALGSVSSVCPGGWTPVYDRLHKETGALVVVNAVDTNPATLPTTAGNDFDLVLLCGAAPLPTFTPSGDNAAIRAWRENIPANVSERVYVPAGHQLLIGVVPPASKRVTIAVEAVGILPATR